MEIIMKNRLLANSIYRNIVTTLSCVVKDEYCVMFPQHAKVSLFYDITNKQRNVCM